MKLRILFLTLGLACILYGILVSTVGSGTWFFMVWLAAGVFFVLLYAACRTGLWQRLPSAVHVLFFGALGVFAAAFLIFCVVTVPHFGDRGKDGLDYLIVLGAQVNDDGPSAVLSFRLEAAREYLEQNPDTVCIVSGGKGYNEPDTEASVMKAWLTERGIAPERILTEDASRSTVQNIRNSMVLADLSRARVGIVTNNFHVNRAVAIAKKQGLTDVCGIAADSSALFLLNNLLREFLGTVKDLAAGNM